jgi:hypothetical protein
MHARTILLTVLLGSLTSGSVAGQGPPPITLEGRESVEQMKRFEPFIGSWQRIESPTGTALPPPLGGCVFRRTSHGMTVDFACGPPGDSVAETTRIFWHPVDRTFVYRLYSVRYPSDLLFEGVCEFPAPNVLQQTYRGYYADGRILIYRETKTISGGRMNAKSEQYKNGKWEQIFGGSVYRKAG